jgi:hypothetical protein
MARKSIRSAKGAQAKVKAAKAAIYDALILLHNSTSAASLTEAARLSGIAHRAIKAVAQQVARAEMFSEALRSGVVREVDAELEARLSAATGGDTHG